MKQSLSPKMEQTTTTDTTGKTGKTGKTDKTDTTDEEMARQLHDKLATVKHRCKAQPV